MTRIGTITVTKLAGGSFPKDILQYVIEQGRLHLAWFQHEQTILSSEPYPTPAHNAIGLRYRRLDYRLNSRLHS